MKILYDNLVPDATITALTENPDYLFSTALNDTRLSRVGRTIDIDDQTITFTFTGAVAVTHCVIPCHNMTETAVVKIQGNDSDSWATPAVDVTMTAYGDSYVASFASSSYQYWRLYLDDPDSTDGYIEVCYVFLGTALTMPGMSRSMKIPQKSNSNSSKSISGQLYGDRRLNYKAADITCAAVTETERQSIKTFFSIVDITTPFILLIWEDDLDVEEPIYCSLTKELEWTKLDVYGILWSLTFSFEQCF